jgi:putative transposase
MPEIFHPLLALIASATDRQLAKYVEYLKEENKILRARIPGQVHTKPEERERLLKYGKAIGRAIEELITIVTPGTFYRWVRDEKKGKRRSGRPKGGQRKPKELRKLVIEIANTTGFGLTRIVGELRKLGIRKISRQTVRNILKEEGIQPGPDRTSDNWDTFLSRHAGTLWGCDFFSVRTVTSRGLRRMYVLVFLCLETREAIVSESTLHPNSAWVAKQADLFVDRTAGRETKPDIVMHDKDSKFSKEFVAKLKERGLRTNSLPKASPNLNGRCERVIQTLKLECLAKFIIFGKRHLDYLLVEFVDYYNKHRSHMERDHLPPVREAPEEVAALKLNQIEVKSHVGGLVKSFERKAA